MKVLLKASLTACLFLFPSCLKAQELTLSKAQQLAYQNIWDLKNPEASETETSIDIYIKSLHLIIYHILRNDASEIDKYEKAITKLESRLKDLPKSPEKLFTMAEVSLHYAFVQLKFDNTITAGWAIRKSFKQTEKVLKEYPNYVPILKTAGLLNVIIGSVPKKYEWLVSLVGLNGSIDKGLDQLGRLSQNNNFLSIEGVALEGLLNVYLDLNTRDQYKLDSENNLCYLINALISSKTGKNEISIIELSKLDRFKRSYPVVSYLMGEAKLRAQHYEQARDNYLVFLKNNKGEANVKDAYFKMALAFHLNQKQDSANYYLIKAEKSGSEKTAADRHATKIISSMKLPNRELLKIRMLTDGGYYKKAQEVIDTIDSSSFETFHDQLEYQYRSARLFHKKDQIEKAVELYLEVIKRSPTKGYYYAPNSCLQLGFIFVNQNKLEIAKGYFKQVKGYTKHEYKSSLDQKAKAALSKLQ